MEYGGVPKEAIVLALLVDTIITCDQLEDEIVRVMRDKFLHSPEVIRSRLTDTLAEAVRTTVTGSLSGVCRDPNDDFILECALTAHSDMIITGDKDLLSLKSFGAIQIVTPRQYLDIDRS